MKYFIYKSSGGLFHNLGGLCKAIQYCIENKFILIVDMNKHKAFRDNFTSFFTINNNKLEWYDNYEKVPLELTYFNIPLKIIKEKSIKFVSGKYYIENINISNIRKNNNIIVFARAGFPYNPIYKIKCNITIMNKLLEEEKIKEKYISMHFRNTDLKNNIQAFIHKIKHILQNIKINILYIASDYSETNNIIKKRFPKLHIIQKTIPPKNIKNLHYTSKDSYTEKYEALRDIYYILQSTIFIPSTNSGFSNGIIKMIKNKNTIFPNFSPNVKNIL